MRIPPSRVGCSMLLRQTKPMASVRGALKSLRLRAATRRPRDVLFLAAYYRLAYPDVANIRGARRHFERFGRFEGRSPHPFIDVARLSVQMPGVRLAEVFDTYLDDRTRWALSPSPYLDVARFMDSGPWDGRTHPVVQILRDRASEPWVRSRLGTIDLATAADPIRIAAGVLALRHPGLIRLSALRHWAPPDARPLATEWGPDRYVVAGGFLLADASSELIPGDAVVSDDGTLVRTPQGVLGIAVGDRVVAGTVSVLRPESPVVGLDVPEGGLVVPATLRQREELEDRGVPTLPVGRQYIVDAQRVILR